MKRLPAEVGVDSSYFSFNPASPAVFDATATLPSSKLHEEAASTAPAARSRTAEKSDFEKCMVDVVCVAVGGSNNRQWFETRLKEGCSFAKEHLFVPDSRQAKTTWGPGDGSSDDRRSDHDGLH